MIDGLSVKIAAPEGGLALTYSAADETICLVSLEKGAIATLNKEIVGQIAQFFTLVFPRAEAPEGSRSPSSDWEARMAGIKERYPNAYQPWSDEEDASLWEGHLAGISNVALSKEHQRQPGAISSRLAKLRSKHEATPRIPNEDSFNLIEDDNDER